MLVVTGSPGSGTTLVSEYLDRMGIDMMHGQDPSPERFGRIWEDVRFLDICQEMYNGVVTPMLVRKFQHLANICAPYADKQNWGFKTPIAIRVMNALGIIAIADKIPMRVIHIYRTFSDTCEAWDRKPLKPHSDVEIGAAVLGHHKDAIHYKKYYQGIFDIHLVNIDDVVNYDWDFFKLVNPPKSYIPIQEVILTDRVRLGKASKNYAALMPHQVDEVYQELEKLKWRPNIPKKQTRST